MRVVALFRVSTEKQANEGASLDAQQRAYRELATRSGWSTVAEYRGCESATQAASDRRVLQQLLACLRDSAPDAVYVHEQSRLTRGDELEVALLMRELRERGVKIIVGGVVRDPSSIDEGFMIGIQSLVDRTESLRIKERMGRGKREKARQGKKTGGPAPFGYENPPPGAPGRGTLRVVESEACVVRRVFDMAASGHGERAVARALDEMGVQAPRGGRWSKSTVRRLLRCPAYIGVSAARVWVAEKGTRNFRFSLDNPDAIVVENAHPAIISRETWDAVHGRPHLPRSAAPRLLTGLLFVNGDRFGGDLQRGAKVYRAKRGVKGAAWLGEAETDAAVWEAFASLATSPQMVERLMDAARNPREQELVAQEIEHLEGEIGKARRRQARLIDMRADDEIDKESFTARSEETRRSIESLGAQLATQRAKVTALDGSHAARVVKAVQLLLAGRARLTAAQRRMVLRSIIRRVDVVSERHAAPLSRDAQGRIVAATGQRWAIRSVSLQLALPASSDATWANVGRDGAITGGESGQVFEKAAGRLVTSDCGCGQAPNTDGILRDRGLVTNASCSGRPARAKPCSPRRCRACSRA